MSEEKRERAMRIFQALSGVDGELLERCGNDASAAADGGMGTSSFKFWRAGRILAAAVCFAVLGAMAVGINQVYFRPKGSTMELAQDINEAAPAQAMEAAMGDGEFSGAETVEAVLEAGLLSDEETVEAAMEDEGLSGVEIAQEVSEADRLSGAKPEGSRKEASESPLSEKALSYKIFTQDVTVEEAGTMELFGAYVPDTVPTGYIYESGHVFYAGEEAAGQPESIFLTWTKGLDYVNWIVRRVQSEGVILAEAHKPETYDVRLYEIPYADTVPEAYREIFNNPIFDSDDFTREIVEARMKTVEDAKDTASPRGCFSVYYKEDSILVEFRGRGSAREIWEMFLSIGAEEN